MSSLNFERIELESKFLTIQTVNPSAVKRDCKFLASLSEPLLSGRVSNSTLLTIKHHPRWLPVRGYALVRSGSHFVLLLGRTGKEGGVAELLRGDASMTSSP